MTPINTVTGISVPLSGTFVPAGAAAHIGANPPVAMSNSATQAPLAPPEAMARLASLQGGLAPLFADLAASLGRSDLPQALRGAVQAVLATAIDGSSLDGKSVEAALMKSAVLGEAAASDGVAVPADRTQALLVLRSLLRAASPGGTRPSAVSSSLPPPHRAALPVGEPPALPSIASLDGDAMVQKLWSETDAALARVTLQQIASLPDAAGTHATQRLVLDVPIAIAQGHAVIAFEIEPDRANRDQEDDERSAGFRINLALDIEPLGPVRASVSEAGGRTHVSLFAEREATARVLREGLPALQGQLAEAALEPGELNCRVGTPPRKRAGPGLFVDRAT